MINLLGNGTCGESKSIASGSGAKLPVCCSRIFTQSTIKTAKAVIKPAEAISGLSCSQLSDIIRRKYFAFIEIDGRAMLHVEEPLAFISRTLPLEDVLPTAKASPRPRQTQSHSLDNDSQLTCDSLIESFLFWLRCLPFFFY
jgi:hypothetical protein